MSDKPTTDNLPFSVAGHTTLPQWFTQWLNRRGILDAGLYMGWQPHQNGAKYPVFNPVSGDIESSRWKAAPGQGGAKYTWLGEKGAAKYYAAIGLPDAIAAADGLLYIANGEPSVLVFRSVGMKNVLSWFGEGSIPDTLPKDLLSWGVSRVIYLPDNDFAGYQAAIKLRDVLQGSGIDYEFKTWGLSQVDLIHVNKQSGKQTPYIACDDIPEKSDANDYWQLVNFDTARFIDRLHQALTLRLPEPKPKQLSSANASDDETPQGLIEAIANRLGITGWKDNGWSSKHVSSPFREDKHPSFSLNRHSGVGIDWGDNRATYSPVQIAEASGVDWTRYYPDDYEKEEIREENCALGQVWFPDGMPDSWRSLLLNHMGKTAAAIIEMANDAARQGMLDSACFCIDDLIAAMDSTQFRLSAKTIRNQFAELKTIFFPESETLNINKKKNTLSDFGNNPCGGRPTACYTFQSVPVAQSLLLQRAHKRLSEDFMKPHGQDSILPIFTGEMLQAEGIELSSENASITANVLNKHEAVNRVHLREEQKRNIAYKRINREFKILKTSLSNPESTPLIDGPIKNGAGYRDLFYKSKIACEEVAFRSRKEIAQLVGIQPQQVTALHKRVKVESVERTPEFKIQSVTEINQLAAQKKASPRYVAVTDIRTGERLTIPNSKGYNIFQVANEAIQNGNVVKVCLQLPNEQYIMAVSKRMYQALGKYLIASWIKATLEPSYSEIIAADDVEQKDPVQLDMFPDETKQAPTVSPLPLKPVKPGQYYRAGYDPAWVAEHLNRVLLLVGSPYRLKVLALVGQNESLEYRVRMVTSVGMDVGKVTDKLLLHAIHIDPIAAEAVMLGGIAQ
jgi:hypothetical protein